MLFLEIVDVEIPFWKKIVLKLFLCGILRALGLVEVAFVVWEANERLLEGLALMSLLRGRDFEWSRLEWNGIVRNLRRMVFSEGISH